MKKVEKFDEMEANFKEVSEELDSVKDENYQNKKVVRDLRNELAFKKDIIESIEKELDEKDEMVQEIKSQLRRKEEEVETYIEDYNDKAKELEDLETFTKERVDEINILRENNKGLGLQIVEGLKAEKEVEMQNNIIEQLKKDNVEKLRDEYEQIDKLKAEISELKHNIQTKEELLRNAVQEKEFVSLDEGLGQKNLYFSCAVCGQIFENRNNMKEHNKSIHQFQQKESVKAKLSKLESEVKASKLKLKAGLFELKEMELEAAKECSCKGVCRINHLQYNWSKSSSKEIYSKLKELTIPKNSVNKLVCVFCDKSLRTLSQLGRHMKLKHEAKSSRNLKCQDIEI